MDFVAPVGSSDPTSWVNGDRATGVKGSRVPHQAFTDSNAEVVNAIIALGKTPDANQLDQLAQALQEKFADELTIISQDTTYVVGTLPSDFTSLQAAHDSLDSAIILPGVTVTFQMKDEVHTYSSGVVFDHPQARQMEIVAASVPASLPTIGSMVFGSTWPSFYNNRLADNASNETYLQGLYACKVVFTSGGFTFNTGIKLIKDITFEGNATHPAIIALNCRIDLENTTFIDGVTGIVLDYAVCTVNGLWMSGIGTGVSMRSSTFSSASAEVTMQGGAADGFLCNWDCMVVIPGGFFHVRGYNGNGVNMSWNSSFHAGDMIATGCGKHGVFMAATCSAYVAGATIVHCGWGALAAYNGSFADISNGNPTSHYNGAGYTNLYASRNSHIYAAGAPGGTTYSPSYGSVGNSESQIT